MGDIKPENTSAIIAVQKQSAVPLENQQAYFHQFVEDQYLVWSEFIVRKYVADRVLPQDVDGDVEYANFNAEPLQDKLINVKVDVGASSHWSEITSMQTLDQLLAGQYIDFIEYLERIGNGIIPKKQELIDTRKEQQEQQAEFEQMAQVVDTLPPEVKAQFDQLPPQEQEMAVREYMAQSQV